MTSTGENGASRADPGFTCSCCNFSFFDKASLDRHLIQVHKEQPSDGPDKGENTTIQTSKFVCTLCQKNFVRQNNLKRHWLSVHEKTPDDPDKAHNSTDQQSKFFCSHCNKDFFHKYSLEIHVDEVHKEDTVKKTTPAPPNSGAVKFSCSLCHKNFTRKNCLKRHWIQVHKQDFDDPHEAKKTSCIHPNCDKVFYHRTRMLKHLEDDHDMRLSSSTHRFDTERDFLDWKEREERNNLVQFSKQSGSNFGKDTRYSYYICEHDGSDRAHRAHWQPARLSSRRNKKGRVKTGHVCPARMLVKSELNSSVLRVTYISTHNHEPRPRVPSARSRRTCSRTTPHTRRTGKPKSRGKKVASSVSQATQPSTAHAEDNNAALFIADDLGNEDMDSESDSGTAGSEVLMLEETRGYLAELIGMVQNEQVQRTVLPQIHDVLKKAVYQCKAIKAQAASASSVVQLYQSEPVLRQPLPGQREHDYYCI
ncbi:PREDICTED: PR domain zinc finger protein 15-like [Branchiostoma belcheri]|uniref:PR domain zinc finger protein 15-like n=1 Tax=Branchiostoma belcheri TaxID=7741 RepID=A0A6P4ZVU4_BRABE|nr:PREDICTED: PR domain zinc finger protein 15-like [Branchiostoma belcheri]